MSRYTYKRRVSAASKATVIRQLASMIPAGIPITRCMEILEKTQPDQAARTAFHKIKLQLTSGHSMSDSFKSQPDWFDVFTCQLVYLGEKTGKLDEVLLMLADHHENIVTFRRNISQALFYPCLILSVALAMSCCMFIFVIPTFAELFKDIPQSLPLLTRILFSASRILTQCLPWFLSCIVISACLLLTPQRSKLVKLVSASFNRLPPLKRVLQLTAIIYFSRHLAIALAAGIPILEALAIIAATAKNPALASDIRRLRASLCAGQSLHQAMIATTMFPNLLQQMVRVGEETGTLDKNLEKAASLLETELNTHITQLTRMLEPLIMSVLGVLIGGLVIGMYLPIFNLGSVI